jgi:hypothetical protein
MTSAAPHCVVGKLRPQPAAAIAIAMARPGRRSVLLALLFTGASPVYAVHTDECRRRIRPSTQVGSVVVHSPWLAIPSPAGGHGRRSARPAVSYQSEGGAMTFISSQPLRGIATSARLLQFRPHVACKSASEHFGGKEVAAKSTMRCVSVLHGVGVRRSY